MLVGTVIDKRNVTPLSYVAINILGTKISIATDTLGRFSLKIPTGKYRIQALGIGYTDLYTKEITFKSNERVVIDFYLGTTIIE